MPHFNIKYFPVTLTATEEARLIAALTDAVGSAFKVDESVISISLEPVEAEAWNEQVYIPEILDRANLLRKQPNY